MSAFVWARQTHCGDEHPAFLIDKVSSDEAKVWIKWDSNRKEELLPKSFVRSELPKRNRSASNTVSRGLTLEKKSAKSTQKRNVVVTDAAKPDVVNSSVLPFLAASAEMSPVYKQDTDDEGDLEEGKARAPSPVISSSAVASSEYNEDTDDDDDEKLDHPPKKAKTDTDHPASTRKLLQTMNQLLPQ